MDFTKYRHLKKLAFAVGSFGEFLTEAAKWPRRYGVGLWSKVDYEWFYNRIKGGSRYEYFQHVAKAA